MQYHTSLVWFRRDLRMDDHAALFRALKASGRVYCVFVFDREILDALPSKRDRRVEFMRDSWLRTGEAPSIRTLGRESGVPVKELYQLFPKGPAKLAAKIGGIPKPHGCI